MQPTTAERPPALHASTSPLWNAALPMLALAAIGISIPSVFPIGIVNEAAVVLLAVGAALGLQMLTGLAGQLSLGSAALMAVGAFTVGVTSSLAPGIPFVILPLWAGIVGAAVGFLVGLPALRLRGFYLIIATLALHYIVLFVLQRIQESGPGVVGYIIQRPDLVADDVRWYYVLLAVALALTVLTAGYKASATGRAWQMMAHNEIAAEAIGIDIRRMKLQVFVLSSFLTALIGGLGAYTIGVVTYESYPLGLAISYIASIIIAGLGTTAATWLGAAFVVWIPLWVTRLLGAYGSVQNASVNAQIGVLIFGISIIGFMMFAPGGLNALIATAWRRATSWVRAGRGSARPDDRKTG